MGAPEALPTYVYFVYFIYRRFLVYFLYGPVIFRSGFFRIHNVSFIFSLMGFKNVSFYFFFCPRLPFFICTFMPCWRFCYFCACLSCLPIQLFPSGSYAYFVAFHRSNKTTTTTTTTTVLLFQPNVYVQRTHKRMQML